MGLTEYDIEQIYNIQWHPNWNLVFADNYSDYSWYEILVVYKCNKYYYCNTDDTKWEPYWISKKEANRLIDEFQKTHD